MHGDALKLRYHPRVDPTTHRLVAVQVEVVRDAPGDADDARQDVADDAVDLVAMTCSAIVRAGSEAGTLDIPLIAFELPSPIMSEPALVDGLATAAREAGISPRRIELLLYKAGRDVTQGLSRAGFNLAAGGVGADGPSLVELVDNPFDALCVHRRLIDRLPTEYGCAVLVRSLVQLGHTLELRVVVSGVDSVRTLAYLRELECDEIQGRMVGAAADVKEIRAQWMSSGPGVRVGRIM